MQMGQFQKDLHLGESLPVMDGRGSTRCSWLTFIAIRAVGTKADSWAIRIAAIRTVGRAQDT